MEALTLTYPDLVADGLAAVEARMRAGTESDLPEVNAAIDQLLSSGGKRIRPTLVLLVGGLLEADLDRTVILGAAAELLHTATLVHDDLIDGSLLRRGFPTLNAKWEDGVTVLIGDYLFARAARLAAQTESLQLMERFATTLAVIVNGELKQLLGWSTGELRANYFDRVYSKTGSLFELSAEAAALLADVDPATTRSMKDFGRHLGVAFQIVDDVLDFTGNAEKIGKPVGGDLRQGLVTLPTIAHLEANPDDVPLVERMARGELDPEQAERLVEDIRRSGSIEAAMREASEYLDTCERLLDSVPSHRPEMPALRDLTRYVLRRTQ